MISMENFFVPETGAGQTVKFALGEAWNGCRKFLENSVYFAENLSEHPRGEGQIQPFSPKKQDIILYYKKLLSKSKKTLFYNVK